MKTRLSFSLPCYYKVRYSKGFSALLSQLQHVNLTALPLESGCKGTDFFHSCNSLNDFFQKKYHISDNYLNISKNKYYLFYKHCIKRKRVSNNTHYININHCNCLLQKIKYAGRYNHLPAYIFMISNYVNKKLL